MFHSISPECGHKVHASGYDPEASPAKHRWASRPMAAPLPPGGSTATALHSTAVGHSTTVVSRLVPLPPVTDTAGARRVRLPTGRHGVAHPRGTTSAVRWAPPSCARCSSGVHYPSTTRARFGGPSGASQPALGGVLRTSAGRTLRAEMITEFIITASMMIP